MKIMTKLPLRKDVNPDLCWNLEDIYASEEAWEQDWQEAESRLQKLKAWQGTLARSGQHLAEVLEEELALQLIVEKLYMYARMRRDEDNTNSFYQGLSNRAESLSVKIETGLAFLIPEILALPEDVLNRFQQDTPQLDLYQFYLEKIRRQKPHILSLAEEEILAQANELAQGPEQIFRMLNNADLKFDPIEDEQGNKMEVTHGRYIQLMENPNREIRRQAFESLYQAYGNLKNTLASTYVSSVKADKFFALIRHYGSALESALFEDKVDLEVYDNLIAAVRSELNSMHRYVALRQKALGLEDLHMYDLYAPLVKEIDWKITYPEAVEIVKKALKPLGEEYQQILSRGLAEGWVDVPENQGKTSGAYSWGPYGVHPYVLLNHQDNLDNVFTLAHEMGHAMHSFLSDRQQPYVYSQYTIFAAEVASTVNESLLMHYLLEQEQDRNRRLYLLNHYLEQFRGTVFRQTMFAEFEKIVHQKAEAEQPLTLEVLNEIYRQLNQDYFGERMSIDSQIDLEWARIPHFYSAFYVYKYATGFSAATAISQRILQGEKGALEAYLSFLQSGGSDYPLNLLKKAGVDLSTPQPIQEALQTFAKVLQEMETTL